MGVSGKGARNKGLSFEREIAKKLRRLYPAAKRHLEVQLSDCKGYDLDDVGPFRFQLKRLKTYAPITKIEEIKDLKDTIPALITKGDHKKDVVCLYLEDFINVIERLAYCNEEAKKWLGINGPFIDEPQNEIPQ